MTDDPTFVPAPVRSQALASGPVDARADLAACKQILAEGSKSFAAASLLLPRRMRGPAAAFYAFCRVADDLVDFSADPSAAVVELAARLDRIYAAARAHQRNPQAVDALGDPVDRAFARVVGEYAIPRGVVDALIEGFAWDADERAYETMDEVLGYCARVASAVGVVMTAFMGPRDRRTLARACDLGAAMQLTNICRDVLEDADRGRLYLPAAWLRERGVDPVHFVAAPRDYVGDQRITGAVEAALDVAEGYYRRADAGIGMLPWDCRPAIRAASTIYADIGRVIRERGCDPLRGRAHTSKGRKLWLLACAWVRRTPKRVDAGQRDAPAIPACDFLLEDFE
ncbi:phytoene/squalene synthase family protein [Pseudenhygromyxa sp. WMMC2535]|uniref:squalene/phytoene synthase family protein n=1 Tax=Pseudenhygromyxa sp. WMMC2535 TaxID=2712867 RepID=UPI001595C25F|nr:phytoene/squalene synthase family protein [Pseudenhygromyxa sp. WMMC2535]